MDCRLTPGMRAPCIDDLCHSGSETLCGIPDEFLYDDEDEFEEYGEDGEDY